MKTMNFKHGIKCLIASSAIFVGFSAAAASFKCDSPSAHRNGGFSVSDVNGAREKLYTFTVSTTCTLEGVPLNSGLLVRQYSSLLGIKPNIVTSSKALALDGRTGFLLDLTELVDTGHGPLTIVSDVSLLGAAQDFVLESKSRSTKGNGDAALTKRVNWKLSVAPFESVLKLAFTKTVDVLRPRKAIMEWPFVSAVLDGITNDMKTLAASNSSHVLSILNNTNGPMFHDDAL